MNRPKCRKCGTQLFTAGGTLDGERKYFTCAICGYSMAIIKADVSTHVRKEERMQPTPPEDLREAYRINPLYGFRVQTPKTFFYGFTGA